MSGNISEVKIIIVDDHQVVVNGLTLILNREANLKVVGQCDSSEKLFELIAEEVPHLIFLDIILQDESGLDILPRLRDEYPDIRIIIFTGNTPDDMIAEALEQGASAVLPKDALPDEILHAVTQVLDGEIYLAESLKVNLVQLFIKRKSSESDVSKSYNTLTPREKEIFLKIVEGLSNKEIAYELSISVHTVETHKSAILRKLNAKNMIELLKMAIRLGLVEV